ncbi:(p)ppGpp synthetase [uncultured Desulfuromusa sp.]|uniref:GTP pyrophosphokinase n=1 Tax=uncultured Desulfuromusa sp. TaxID=219183 RepID=UPI002AA7E1E8|nr:(p)ppGpp synthetase [uncultured Desulfuromusa sp.]
MASLDFEFEKRKFRKFYDQNLSLIEETKNSYIGAIERLIEQSDVGEVTKIEGRIKDKEECIKKFQRKYQAKLEADEQPYRIKDYLSDLIGIRVICLYEDQISVVSDVLKNHFRIIDVTDKIAAVESTEDLFGYKGLHMDLVPVRERGSFSKSREFPFEVQIRSLIQDAWSVLDHKIKYKKSIPNNLKRRINVLSALFELADREFKEIRNATMELLQQATADPVSESFSDGNDASSGGLLVTHGKSINAFNFLRVAGHFFKDFVFEDYKVDNFVQDILKQNSDFKRADLHKCLVENLKIIKDYRAQFLLQNPENTFSPYTAIRHCLYCYDRATFGGILSRGAKERFEEWLKDV